MASQAYISSIVGTAVAPAAFSAIAQLPAPPLAGFYRVRFGCCYADGTLDAAETDNGGNMFALFAGGSTIVPILPVSPIVGQYTFTEFEIYLDGETGVNVGNIDAGSTGVTYVAFISAEPPRSPRPTPPSA